MGETTMTILNPGTIDFLENHVPVGVTNNGIDVFLREVGFILKGKNGVGFIESDELEPYMTISKVGGVDNIANVNFDNIPYTLLVSNPSKSETMYTSYVKDDDKKESFSFELLVKLTDHSFSYSIVRQFDPLSLLDKVIGAFFAFSKTNTGE